MTAAGNCRLAGKCALITGAARGIGLAFAKRYLEEGARVAIGDINFELAQKSAAEISKKFRQNAVLTVNLDVGQQKSIDAALNATLAKFGQIDILINGAALFDMAPIAEITRESYERLFAVNVSGTLFMMQAVARHMIARGQGGKIINMASQAGRRGEPLVGVYCATKAAVISLTQSAGLNLAKMGINVNAIAPGVVDGELWDGVVDPCFAKWEGRKLGEKKRLAGEAVPFGRIARAEEDLAGMAVFLASADANYIVGQTFNVDGGNCLN